MSGFLLRRFKDPFLPKLPRVVARLESTASTYPFSKTAIVVPPPKQSSPVERLREGIGLMEFVRKTLPTPTKQKWLATLFSRTHPARLLPGSVLAVTMTHSPSSFAGVLMSVRRRGPDTSFVLRNVIQQTGVETQIFVASPHLRNIRVIQRANGRKGIRRQRRAKLFFLRDAPDKMSTISAGMRS